MLFLDNGLKYCTLTTPVHKLQTVAIEIDLSLDADFFKTELMKGFPVQFFYRQSSNIWIPPNNFLPKNTQFALDLMPDN